jgi:hypothetical protein
MRKTLIFTLLIISFSSFAQNSAVTDFKDRHATALSLYFYPSTLRMVNLDRSKDFDNMIRDIRKARFFKMDSGAVTPHDLQKFTGELSAQGFEEIMFIKNRQMDVQVWALEKRNPEIIIISKSEEDLLLLEVIGMINIAKIPGLIENFRQNAFLDVLNLNEKKNK